MSVQTGRLQSQIKSHKARKLRIFCLFLLLQEYHYLLLLLQDLYTLLCYLETPLLLSQSSQILKQYYLHSNWNSENFLLNGQILYYAIFLLNGHILYFAIQRLLCCCRKALRSYLHSTETLKNFLLNGQILYYAKFPLNGQVLYFAIFLLNGQILY